MDRYDENTMKRCRNDEHESTCLFVSQPSRSQTSHHSRSHDRKHTEPNQQGGPSTYIGMPGELYNPNGDCCNARDHNIPSHGHAGKQV